MKKHQKYYGIVKFNPIVTAILLTIPAISQAADLSMVNGTPSVANGVPVVNINTANSNGISHNVYNKLNVGKEGLIFNNSQNGAATQLAGQIAGNSNLASGTAKVILNEVTSKNKSSLNGVMEVAGDKAHLIIANPNGISCESCGFINTNKVTITTGKPDVQDGELKGYSISSGTVTANDMASDSPTEILARYVAINGNVVTSSDLTVVAGTNYVNTDAQVTGSVKGSGLNINLGNTYGIDVAKLGGMYANKINLISTENGVGVRNLGKINAGNGGIQIDSKGRLLNNSATLQSLGNVAIKTNGALENETGIIATDGAISIDTSKNALRNLNSGTLSSGTDIAISSGALNNSNGKITANNSVSIDTNGSTLTNTGKGAGFGINAGAIFLKSGTLNNSGGQIKGYYVGSSSASLDNSKGIIDSWGDVDITTTKSLNNDYGRIRSGDGHVKIDNGKNTLNNNNTRSADAESNDSLGIIAGAGGIQITAGTIKNEGQIITSGDLDIKSAGNLDNVWGKIQSGKTIDIQAVNVSTGKGSIVANSDLNVNVSGDISSNIGIVNSQEGTLNIKARKVDNYSGILLGHNINIEASSEVNNNAALMVAVNDITITTPGSVYNQNSNLFTTQYGHYLGLDNQEGGMIAKGSAKITANNLYNSASRLITEKGTLDLNITKSLANDSGFISAVSGITAKTGSLDNSYATMHSAGDVTINTGSFTQKGSGSIAKNNATGVLSAGNNLTLDVSSSFANHGWITGKNNVAVSSTGSLTNYNTIYSENALNVYAKNAIDNNDTIVGDRSLSASTMGAITNKGNLYSDGKASIKANLLYNSLLSSVAGGGEELELDVGTRMGLGKIVGL